MTAFSIILCKMFIFTRISSRNHREILEKWLCCAFITTWKFSLASDPKNIWKEVFVLSQRKCSLSGPLLLICSHCLIPPALIEDLKPPSRVSDGSAPCVQDQSLCLEDLLGLVCWITPLGRLSAWLLG